MMRMRRSSPIRRLRRARMVQAEGVAMASWEALSFTRELVSSDCARSVGDYAIAVKVQAVMDAAGVMRKRDASLAVSSA